MKKHIFLYGRADWCLYYSNNVINTQCLKEMWASIKKRRKKKDYTQKSLAAKLWVDRGYYWLVENGKTNPTLLLLKRVCIELDMHLVITPDNYES